MLKVGDTIWRFEPCHRVYAKDRNGRATGGPIYREYWRPEVILGENRRSWLCGTRWRPDLYKAPKNGPHCGWCFSEEELEARCWIEVHRYGIVRALERIDDPKVLRQVAELIGWSPK